MSQQLFSPESVTEGHPDKVCDRVSDAIPDALFVADPRSRVTVETMVATGFIHIVGEVATEVYIEISGIVRREVLSIGYDSSRVGFDGASYGVFVSFDGQSPDIVGGISRALEVHGTQGGDPCNCLDTSDQGIMSGYASSDTPDLMPTPIWLAHRLAKHLTDVHKQGTVEGLRPGGKIQVTLAYANGHPVGINTVVVSTRHDKALSQSTITDTMRDYVTNPVIEESGLALVSDSMTTLTDPSGHFALGSPAADVNLTGRKIIVDTYGGMVCHGGGAFSDKDPSKVDRSITYAIRWVAKDVVAAGTAQRCEIQLAYTIGRARPIDLCVNTFGTTSMPEDRVADATREIFDLRPLDMIEDLDLLRPIYRETATYDHFGRDQFPWEAINHVEQLRAALAWARQWKPRTIYPRTKPRMLAARGADA